MAGKWLSEQEWALVADMFDDAWAYRMGEADGLDDESLDPGDRRILLRYEAFGVGHDVISLDG
jgi:hypothetical protein